MASMVSMLLGTQKKGEPPCVPIAPPDSAVRFIKLSGWDEPVGKDDMDDVSYSSFSDLIKTRTAVTSDRLLRMAWAIRRTGRIGNFEMKVILDVDSTCMKYLWRIFEGQGWVISEHKGGRYGLFYKQTELGKKIFASAGDEERKAA